MGVDVYRELADHLDRLGAFPPSQSGVELQLLKELFTPEEAVLTTKLTLSRETAAAIASRTGLDPKAVEERLESMAQRGLVFNVRAGEGPPVYQAVPWVVGIYEFQVNSLSKRLVEYIAKYAKTRQKRTRTPAAEQMRVIPSVASLEIRPMALPYEMADELVNAHTRYAVAPCICRRKATLQGQGCDAPEESCLLFGDFADYYIRTGRGRSVTREQVTELLKRAEASNLVLSPSNSKRISFICCCCGCCCGLLRGLKLQPNPSEVIQSPFVAKLSVDECSGCLICIDRCQMEALTADGDKVKLEQKRCIGCGLCVSTCPADALQLERREWSDSAEMPADFAETWRRVAQTQALTGASGFSQERG